jgi:acetaldehyde dehydrogenase (acetylating)
MSDSASDLVSISTQEARRLASSAKEAQAHLAELNQSDIDTIVDAMAKSAAKEARTLATMAVKETGYGVTEDKVRKNLFAAEDIHHFIQPMKTVGVIRRDDNRKVIEIAEPFGVVAAIVPSTNPTSTAIYKTLIALKARCAIAISPHPAAVQCITRTAEIMAHAAQNAGAPEHSIGWMTNVTIEGTNELMRHRDVSVILATGGMGLVRSAYSAGKPAYGVGPGNAPAYIEKSADIPKAVSDIVTGKTFDNGVLCSSENSVVVDEAIAAKVTREFEVRGGYFLSAAESNAVSKVLVTSQRLPDPSLVGRPALEIANKANLQVPSDTRVLIAPLEGVGRDYPLSIEKLCPVLSFYVVRDWHEGCERCKEILQYGGMGHTMSIHSNNESVILEFGLRKPAFRIVVNTPTTHGSIGLTTGLDPAMTLGCGGYGGNITSDNISPMHLLNIKRLAYELKPAPSRSHASKALTSSTDVRMPAPRAEPKSPTIDRDTFAARVNDFLAARGLQQPKADQPEAEISSPPEEEHQDDPVAFVCEDDVRQALRDSQTITINDSTIVTPSARDLANGRQVFIDLGAGL